MKRRTQMKKRKRDLKRRWFSGLDERTKEVMQRAGAITGHGIGKGRSR